MALTQFIKDLLYLNDKLIIPGFGGFVAQYTPAQINKEKHVLLPPGKYFIFDSTLTEDDGVLSSYVSKKKSVSLADATLAVKEMVSDFRKKLNEGNTLFIDEVGYFMQDDNKVIRFKRNEEINYNPESYGLNTIAFKVPAQQIQTPEETISPVKRKNTVGRILIIFLIINIIGALSAILYWKYNDITSYFKNFIAKKNITSVHDSINLNVNPDTTEIGQFIDTSTNIRNALRYEEAQKPDSSVISNEVEKNYYIIAGSFQSFDKAEIHAKTLSKLGLKPEIIEFSQDLFRISVGEFKSKEEALNQLELIKSKKGAEKAWLLVK